MKFSLDKAMLAKMSGFLKKYKYLLIVAVAGVALMLIPIGGAEDNASGETPASVDNTRETEQRLKEALEKMDGVGRAEVVLTLKSSMETVYATDTRADSSETVVISAGSGLQQAVVSVKNYPRYQGALIVCDGGGSPAVRLEVTNAVAALTGLTADKITVAKRESGN